MEGILGGLLLIVAGCAIILWLYVRQHGRAYFWGRVAARAKANHDASIIREKVDQELIKLWLETKEKNETNAQTTSDCAWNERTV